jgi:hypothetical protein
MPNTKNKDTAFYRYEALLIMRQWGYCEQPGSNTIRQSVRIKPQSKEVLRQKAGVCVKMAVILG